MSKFCYLCGQILELRIPIGDDLLRECCSHCDYIHYQNPRILVSCIVHNDRQILWIKRGLQPRQHFWAMPAGFMERGESLQQAAARELFEETGLDIRPDALSLCVVSSLAYINEVYIVFRTFDPRTLAARNSSLTPPSDEIEDLAFFDEENAPWSTLAYPDTEQYMRSFYQQMRSQNFETYLGQYSQSLSELKRLL